MSQYLLDTNICIYYLNGQFGLDDKLDKAGVNNCLISEISVAELKFGVENSVQKAYNRGKVEDFISRFSILPIFNSLDVYAREKARLRKLGKSLDDFDLLIGATALHNGLILVTRNVSDFDRLSGIQIEDWTV